MTVIHKIDAVINSLPEFFITLWDSYSDKIITVIICIIAFLAIGGIINTAKEIAHQKPKDYEG